MRSPRRGAEFPLTHQSSPSASAARQAGSWLASLPLVTCWRWGQGTAGRWPRVVCGKVSRYCLAHARCPVLAVPPPALPQEMSHGLLGWGFWHRPLTPDQIRQDRGKAAA